MLTKAIQLGDPLLVAPLLDIEGVCVNRRDKLGSTPLLLATSYGNYEITKLLLKHKTQLEDSDSIGNTPIFNAVLRDNLPLIQLLLMNGASLYHRNYERKLPLDYAKSKKCRNLLKRLIGRSSSSFLPTAKSLSPVQKAIPKIKDYQSV